MHNKKNKSNQSHLMYRNNKKYKSKNVWTFFITY